MGTVRSRARARNRARPTLAWLILAIVAVVIALSVRLAAADPIEAEELIEDLDSEELHASGFADRELDDLESDELLQSIDELAADQLDELGLDPEALDGGSWTSDERRASPMWSSSPIGRVDLSLVYRHVDPIASERRDELLLVGTWRR
ncbi:MAG: hypothetical protein JNL83_18065 [Myxococcales bacterium]|nr:hypothetical protein [Myxococcales bacterium]